MGKEDDHAKDEVDGLITTGQTKVALAIDKATDSVHPDWLTWVAAPLTPTGKPSPRVVSLATASTASRWSGPASTHQLSRDEDEDHER